MICFPWHIWTMFLISTERYWCTSNNGKNRIFVGITFLKWTFINDDWPYWYISMVGKSQVECVRPIFTVGSAFLQCIALWHYIVKLITELSGGYSRLRSERDVTVKIVISVWQLLLLRQDICLESEIFDTTTKALWIWWELSLKLLSLTK